LDIQNPKKINIKINNKIIHQSKLLNYFKKNYEIKKIEKEANDLINRLYKNLKNKDYPVSNKDLMLVSNKDLMLLESLKSDGVQISKKYQNLFEFDQSNVPTDIQLLINNSEIAMVLLRIVEIIGEDDLNELGSDTLYFIISALNQLNIDPIRNNILLKVLPLKV
jgi:alpha-N-acetylglucosamine transferase